MDNKGLTQESITRLIITAIFIIIIIAFFNKIMNMNEPQVFKSVNTMAETAENIENTEEFIRNIYIKNHLLIGFDSKTNSITLNDATKIQKPEEAACSQWACICACKNECKTPEERYCRSVEGVESILTQGFLDINKGARYKTGSSLAIDGNKQPIICIEAKRSKEKLEISPCRTEEKLENTIDKSQISFLKSKTTSHNTAEELMQELYKAWNEKDSERFGRLNSELDEAANLYADTFKNRCVLLELRDNNDNVIWLNAEWVQKSTICKLMASEIISAQTNTITLPTGEQRNILFTQKTTKEFKY